MLTCHCHEQSLARHLEELIVPEVGLKLAADEAEARLVPAEHQAALAPLLGLR